MTIYIYGYIIKISSGKEVRVMTNMFTNGLYMNDYTDNSNWAACQAGTSFCANMVNFVHAAFCAVCTFVFALCLIALTGALRSVLISVVLISLAIIGLIIILVDNRIYKAKEFPAVS